MDFTLYWFMFPVSMLIATTAMLSGIGGAAMFTPLFVIVFPLLGPEYPLEATVAAIGTALLTELFGFGSGFVGYLRRRLIDFRTAGRFILIAVPVAVGGALVAHLVAEYVLLIGYAVLMLVLAVIMAFFHHQPAVESVMAEPEPVGAAVSQRTHRLIVDNHGNEHVYVPPPLRATGAGVTGTGAFLTGMLSVGIGEVVMPQLAKRGVPVPVAAATSVMVVIATVAAASFTQISKLISEGGLEAVPWNLVCYTIPGVLIGGQIGPLLHGRISQRVTETAIGGLFLLIAVAMFYMGITRI